MCSGIVYAVILLLLRFLSVLYLPTKSYSLGVLLLTSEGL
jgi:hypothetical protein